MTIAIPEAAASARHPLPDAAAIRALAGAAPRTSPWLALDQAMIDAFADVTRARQWIHVDRERARRESPFGAPVAHGFLTLSLLSHLLAQVFESPGRRSSVNYGFDRVRFPCAVRAGSRIRAAVALGELQELGGGELRVRWDVQVQIEDSPRPALVARWIVQMKY